MGFQVRVETRDLYSVSRGLKRVGDKGLGKIMAKALQEAAQPLRPAIKAEAIKAMPAGYGPTLSRSLRFRQRTQATKTTGRVVFQVFAEGKAEHRDVPALNRGVLRHPLFGNRRRWYAQRIRSGFVDRPLDRLGPDIKRRMNAVIDYVADQIGA